MHTYCVYSDGSLGVQHFAISAGHCQSLVSYRQQGRSAGKIRGRSWFITIEMVVVLVHRRHTCYCFPLWLWGKKFLAVEILGRIQNAWHERKQQSQWWRASLRTAKFWHQLNHLLFCYRTWVGCSLSTQDILCGCIAQCYLAAFAQLDYECWCCCYTFLCLCSLHCLRNLGCYSNNDDAGDVFELNSNAGLLCHTRLLKTPLMLSRTS